MAGAVLLARHGEREDYSARSLGVNWIAGAGASRPWDPLLTPAGVRQAAAMGRAVAEHLSSRGMRPVTRIFCSPLRRTWQTAAAAAESLGVSKVCVENSLVEGMVEDFFRSWAIPGADCTWGGPPGCGKGVPVPLESVRAEARSPAFGLLPSTDMLLEATREVSSGNTISIDSGYKPFLSTEKLPYHWQSPETEEQLTQRVGAFLDAVAAQFSGESVLLVSHGGPTSQTYEYATGEKSPPCNYTAIYLLQKSDAETWTAFVKADTAHLASVPDGAESGLNDAAEQKF